MLFVGSAFAVKTNMSPKHAETIESVAGLLLLGGFSLIGVALQMAWPVVIN
jgi:hypothetical protein